VLVAQLKKQAISSKPLFSKAPLVAMEIQPKSTLISLLVVENKGIRERNSKFWTTKRFSENKDFPLCF